MKWKKNSNLIIILILSVVYTIVTLLDILGPLHANITGNINQVSAITYYSILYWAFAIIITWIVYFSLKKYPEILFFTLLILGMFLVIIEIFLWGWMGP